MRCWRFSGVVFCMDPIIIIVVVVDKLWVMTIMSREVGHLNGRISRAR